MPERNVTGGRLPHQDPELTLVQALVGEPVATSRRSSTVSGDFGTFHADSVRLATPLPRLRFTVSIECFSQKKTRRHRPARFSISRVKQPDLFEVHRQVDEVAPAQPVVLGVEGDLAKHVHFVFSAE